MKFTILGAAGYIGSNILRALEKSGHEVHAPGRNELPDPVNAGHIIYCIGLTSDFRTKPFDTAEAHVSLLNRILRDHTFDSLTYLSSTRVYIHSAGKEVSEEDRITIDPMNPDDLYTLTKLTGERLCLSSGKNTKIVRLSNIFGGDEDSGNFLADIAGKINSGTEVVFHTSLTSAKDYLFIDDAARLVIDIAAKGKQKIYNVASGYNTSNGEIVNELRKKTDFSFRVDPGAKEIIFPVISTARIKNEFNFQPGQVTEHISTLIKTK